MKLVRIIMRYFSLSQEATFNIGDGTIIVFIKMSGLGQTLHFLSQIQPAYDTFISSLARDTRSDGRGGEDYQSESNKFD